MHEEEKKKKRLFEIDSRGSLLCPYPREAKRHNIAVCSCVHLCLSYPTSPQYWLHLASESPGASLKGLSTGGWGGREGGRHPLPIEMRIEFQKTFFSSPSGLAFFSPLSPTRVTLDGRLQKSPVTWVSRTSRSTETHPSLTLSLAPTPLPLTRLLHPHPHQVLCPSSLSVSEARVPAMYSKCKGRTSGQNGEGWWGWVTLASKCFSTPASFCCCGGKCDGLPGVE